ncbi:type II secretion system F family protein [Candidatus Omnitrophota bacterium]
MPLFQYVVKDETGKDITGTHEASDVKELVNVFRSRGYVIVKVTEKKSATSVRTKSRTAKRRRIKIDDLVVFARQMATMIDAGVPLIQSLDILGEQMDNVRFASVIKNVRDSVEGGKAFSESLEPHRKVFSDLFINMVKAGETSGQLYEILDRLASYLEKTANLQKKVKAALIYPSVVTLVALAITIFMMTFVIPRFASIFASLDATLPGPTLLLINVSHFMQRNFLLAMGLLIVGIFLFRRYIKTKKGRMWFDTRILVMPIFGPLLLKVVMSKFSRTLSTLVRSGVPILASFEIVEKTVGNALIASIINEVRENVKEGGAITNVLNKKAIFPTMVTRMIAVGEESGSLEEMLGKIADFYDEQVDIAVDGLTSLIEPLIIVFLGVVIGGMVICMFLPIFSLTQNL